jgi:putative peptide maturation dehydrogenase
MHAQWPAARRFGTIDPILDEGIHSVRVRRCAALLIEPRERIEFELQSLLSGGSGLNASRAWFALAPHLETPVAISSDEIAPLGSVSAREWMPFDELVTQYSEDIARSLIEKGLLVTDARDHAALREREQAFRDTHWHPLSAAAHMFSRWEGVTSGDEVKNVGIASVQDLVEQLGDPPPHFHSRAEASERVPLPTHTPSSFDELLRKRTTCRNYDASRVLPLPTFSHILQRVFGAQAVHAVTRNVGIVKKTSPSAGGLHPTEAYLLIQHVDGITPGLYHYHAGDHALEPIKHYAADAAHSLALDFLSQQDWFAAAHVLVILAPRFLRSFWKYRSHAKVYRALTLDVGHLSQTLQISATEFGLGAFITAAINEVDIERALGLDPMRESPLAICGFGWRAPTCERVEFDPQHAVWPK